MPILHELTLSEILSDPLILSVAAADGWSKTAFRDEMTAAARTLTRHNSRALATSSTRGYPPAQLNEQPLACCA